MKCIDLFSGAGGLTSGFRNQNIKIIGAIDNDKAAIQTHKLNFPNSFSFNIEIKKFGPELFIKKTGISKEEIDLIIGGPPCKTFSSIGGPRISSVKKIPLRQDPRNYLYKFFFDYVEYFKPKAFLMENVPTIVSKYKGDLFTNILQIIKSLGYTPYWDVLNSVNYGVPQTRKRLFLVGFKDKIKYTFPKKTHYYNNKQTTFHDVTSRGIELKKTVTVYDAISDLPIIKDDNRIDELPYSKNTELSEYVLLLRNEGKTVRNNRCRISNERAKTVFSYMKQGSNYMDLPKEIRKILPFREDIFKDRLKRLDYSQPSWTILAHIGMDGYRYIHPTECRTLSVREAARIQSFHDSFIFTGNMRQQYIQVGNAVPPILAEQLAKSIRQTLGD